MHPRCARWGNWGTVLSSGGLCGMGWGGVGGTGAGGGVRTHAGCVLGGGLVPGGGGGGKGQWGRGGGWTGGRTGMYVVHKGRGASAPLAGSKPYRGPSLSRSRRGSTFGAGRARVRALPCFLACLLVLLAGQTPTPAPTPVMQTPGHQQTDAPQMPHRKCPSPLSSTRAHVFMYITSAVRLLPATGGGTHGTLHVPPPSARPAPRKLPLEHPQQTSTRPGAPCLPPPPQPPPPTLTPQTHTTNHPPAPRLPRSPPCPQPPSSDLLPRLPPSTAPGPTTNTPQRLLRCGDPGRGARGAGLHDGRPGQLGRRVRARLSRRQPRCG